MPRLFIIAGCNGAGKTTASYSLLPEMLECHEFVNSDEFAKSLSPFAPSNASVAASRQMLMKVNYLMENRMDFSIETTMATRSFMNIISDARELGYTITVIYFWLNSPELAISRVRARVNAGGHNIQDEVVRRRYLMGLQYFFDIYSKLCDRWVLADNSKTPFTVVAESTGNVTNIRDLEKFKLIWRLVHDTEYDI